MFRRVLRVLAGPVVAVTIFLALGELAARALDVVDRLNGYNRWLFAPGGSPRIPYRLRPGIETTQFGLPVRVNALGLRGPETTPKPAPGVHRVLVLGDSVVFGQGIPDDPLPVVLARNLATAAPGRWEVLNAGVPGYNLATAAAALAEHWRALAPASIVVGASLNDYGPVPRMNAVGLLSYEQPSPIDRSELLLLLRWLAGWRRGELLFQLEAAGRASRAAKPGAPRPTPIDLTDATRRMHLGFYHAPDPDGLGRLRDGLAGLARGAAALGASLVIAIFPESYQVGVPEPDRTPQDVLLGLCRETGVRCLDLLPAFAATGGDLFADAQHPNGAGHRVAARVVADALVAGG